MAFGSQTVVGSAPFAAWQLEGGPSRRAGGRDRARVTSRDVEISPRTVQRIASGLGPAGRRFVRRMIRDHEGWGAVDFEVLRLVGRAVDRIEAFDEAIGSTVVVTGPRGARAINPLLAAQRAEVRQLLALMRRLGSEGEN